MVTGNKLALSAGFALLAWVLMVVYSPAVAQVSQVRSSGGQTPPAVLNGSATLVGHYNPGQVLRLVLGLQPPHMAQEEQFLQELQTRGSPQFHHFLTAEQWNARFAPSAQAEQAVVDWAQSQGLTVTHHYPNRLLVDIEAPSGVIESAFHVTINRYQIGANLYYSNDRDPTIPANLNGILHSVGGLNNIQVLHPEGSHSQEPAFADYVAGPVVAQGPSSERDGNGTKPFGLKGSKAGGPAPNITNGAYDPTDLYSSEAYDTNALYNQGHCCNPLNNPGGTPPNESIAIATAGTQNTNDFTGFHNQYPYLAWHYQLIYIDGTPTCCDIEGTMDFEWSTAMSNSFGSSVNTAEVFMYDGVNANFSTFTDIYNQMLTDGNARVFSTSWGCEEIYCTPTAAMDTDHAIFNSMIGQGWTLVAASGDQGATAGCAVYNIADAVQFPASDPNVVGAGGTSLYLTAGPLYVSEWGWTGGPDGCANNDGGSTGGLSAYYATPGYQSSLGLSSRGVPDVALNADWYNTPQNIFYNGVLQGNGGTSIVAPEMAGFFANENAYLDYLSTVTGGLCNGHACAPIGNANVYLYYFGENPSYAPHYPFYDITVNCNNNDITALYNLNYFCAGTGYDEVTGWGSVNMFQLAWAINTYQAGDFSAPTVTFSGPATGLWYNSDQVVSWTVTDTSGDGLPPTGVAGFSQLWDGDPGDAYSEPTPGSGNSFYSGPQYPNYTNGCLDFTGASCATSVVSQGMHTVNVRVWDNTGFSADYTYGPIGYDTIPPVTVASLSGTQQGSVYISPVQVTLTATDNASGVASTVYKVDSGAQITYTGPFTVSALGHHTVAFHSTDNAGNVESSKSVSFTIDLATSTSLASSLNPSTYGQSVTFTATVTSGGGTPTGTVIFKNGSATLGSRTLSGGKATLATSALTGGSHSITAVYAGGGNFAGSTSSPLTQTVNKAATTTVLSSSLDPSTYGQTVTFTATVSSSTATPTGTVTFKNGATTLGSASLSGGKAKFSTSKLLAGSHSITAVYAGNINFNASTSPAVTQTVNKANTLTAVASSLNPSIVGQKVTFTATVSSSTATPTGSVSFKDGSTTLGSASLSGGKAKFSTSKLAAGNHSITAVYAGTANFNGSTSPVLTQVVNP